MKQYNIQTYQENLLQDQTEPKSKYQPQLKLVKAFYAHSKQINVCRLNNNENMFITYGQDNKCKLWDIFTGKIIASLDGIIFFTFNHPFWQIQHIIKVIILQQVSFQTAAKNFDLATRKCQVLVGHQKLIKCISFRRNSYFIATGSHDKTARLWNGRTGKQIQIFNGHVGIIKSLNFNLDGDKLATFSYDNTARIWDVESGNCIIILGGNEFKVECIQFDNTGDYCVIGTTDQQIIQIYKDMQDLECKVWIMYQNIRSKKQQDKESMFQFFKKQIVTVFYDPKCRVYDVQTGKCISELINENGVMRGNYFGQKNQIITTSFFAPARIYSEAGECLQKLGRDNHQITNYSLSQKGTIFISAYHNGLCKIWKNVNI